LQLFVSAMEQREEAIKQLRPGAPDVALVASSPSVASGSPPPKSPIAQVELEASSSSVASGSPPPKSPIAQVAAAGVASPKIAAAAGTKVVAGTGSKKK
jgi:hypothetical protein